MLRRSLLLAVAAAALPLSAAPAAHKTRNVIFVMTDGLRWQEVFRGADPALTQSDDLRRAYWRDSAQERREALLPFLWQTVAQSGQIFGNRDLGSDASVTNGFNISYPGYNEALTGAPDPRIHSNDAIPNPNATVLDWLNQKPAYRGRVAAFAGWDTFRAILNAPRAGFPVNAGYEPLVLQPSTPKLDVLNQLKAEMTRTFESVPLDSLVLYTALEYLKQKKPSVLFLSLGETDEWAHEGDYGRYLKAAHGVDAYLRLLWTTVQEMPEYKGSTTLIFATDHGRGEGAEDWKGHGARLPDSKYVWMAFLGPDTRPLGERKRVAVTQNQIAATLAALLGEDYPASVRASGTPVSSVLP